MRYLVITPRAEELAEVLRLRAQARYLVITPGAEQEAEVLSLRAQVKQP